MSEPVIINLEQEKKEILKRYRSLLRSCKRRMEKGDKLQIRKAFDVALEAHKDMRRKSGEPYIYHPIAVAVIVADELGLGTTSVVCALLHDVVEDTELSLDDINGMFGERVAKIIDGLTKISGVFDQHSSLQAENFRKMLLTLSDDVRVILIKLADRMHNMRTLDSMKRDKQLKIASETLFLYAPLAHRFGLNAIKTELEDLSLKYTEPEIFQTITQKLKDTEPERKRYINKFIVPVKELLEDEGLKFRIFGRPKSIYSIYNKIKNKAVPFEEIYDIFAIRIIIDANPENEKGDCWKAYSAITDYYHPNPDRLRDWISTPKSNGYESLHTTVMGPEGKWVEVQIRTIRMDDLAEKGYAAHWKYKEAGAERENQLDEWLKRIREMLESSDEDALEFIDDFKLNLFADEIFVFTPKGDMRSLPAGATALDFAFDIHTNIGRSCIGAKVNHKLVPLSYTLKSGDQIEVITSNKQLPKEGWVNFVVTAKAKSKIKEALKEIKKKKSEEGRVILEQDLKLLKIEPNTHTLHEIANYFKLPNNQELFYRIAIGNISAKHLKDFADEFIKIKNGTKGSEAPTLEQLVSEIRGNNNMLVIDENLRKINYKFSPCCNPIPGDDVFGFVTVHDGILIHRVNCSKAVELMSNSAHRIVKAKWTNSELISFLAGIKFTGIDEVGIVNNITRIISDELNVNMRSLKFDSNDGIFEGIIMVFVHDANHLTQLIEKLKQVSGVLTVTRIDGKEIK